MILNALVKIIDSTIVENIFVRWENIIYDPATDRSKLIKTMIALCIVMTGLIAYDLVMMNSLVVNTLFMSGIVLGINRNNISVLLSADHPDNVGGTL